MNKKATAIFLALLTVGMVGTTTAQLEGSNTPDADDTSLNEGSDINVGISSTTQIDVKPNSLDFDGLDVGTQTTEENTGTNTFGSFSIENIGSEYIDRVWATASRPASDPFGTGIPDNYNAGNFLQIKPADSTRPGVDGDDQTYHYVNRYEYANSWNNASGEIPTYIEANPSNVLSSGTAADSFVGRIQAADEWYFYTIATGTSSATCDGGGDAELRIGDSVHSSSDFGTVDFTSSGGDYSTYQLQSTSGKYGVTDTSVNLDFDGGSTTRSYDFLTLCDTNQTGVDENDPHVIRTRYNVQAGDIADLNVGSGAGDNAGDQTQFLLSATDAGENLLPGDHLAVDAAIEVPQGVPQGDVQSGTLTFYVTSDDDAQLTP